MMNAQELILIRHCQAAGQEPDAELTVTGGEQSRNLVDFLSEYPVDYIASSRYKRAIQSIDPYAHSLSLPINLDPRFNERILSATPIENWEEVVRDSFEDHEFHAAGGESATEVLFRAWDGLNDLMEADHNLPVVVTHGNLMALVLHSIDPAFGFTGWKSLTNPDVYLVRQYRPGRLTCERIWRPLQNHPD